MAAILSTVGVGGGHGAPANGGSAYSLMSTAENGDQGDLTTEFNVGGEPSTYTLECYAGEITDTAEWSGWTVSENNNITIKAADGEGHDGSLTGGFILSNSETFGFYIQGLSWTVVEGIHLDNTGGYATYINSSENCRFTKCIFTQDGIDWAAFYARNVYVDIDIDSCLMLSNTGSGIYLRAALADTSFTGCTTRGGKYGVEWQGSTESNDISISSSAIYGAVESFGNYSTLAGLSYNAYSDASRPEDLNGQFNLSIADATDFVAPSVGNYNAQALGILENNGLYDANYPEDIAGNTRNDPPEIGAYEISGAAPVDPELVDATQTDITQTSATIGCSTDTAGGTLYWYVSLSATEPPAATIKSGAGSVTSGSFTPQSGPNTVGIVGLDPDTPYWHYWIQEV